MTEQTDARMVIGKWLNEQPNREVDRVALAELCAELDALSKELEQAKELHKDALILLEQEECRHDETKEKLEHVKMHNVMLLDAAKTANDMLDVEYSTHLYQLINTINATSEQIEAYRAEIIAQSADTIRMDWLVSHVVEVRSKLTYGSEHMFTSQITDHDEEEDICSTNLREQIDAAIRNNKE